MYLRTNTYWQHAPAKLNLFLELLGRRTDGYHELETVMVAVSLFDTLWVTPNDSGAVSLYLESTHSEEPLRNATIQTTNRVSHSDIATWHAQTGAGQQLSDEELGISLPAGRNPTIDDANVGVDANDVIQEKHADWDDLIRDERIHASGESKLGPADLKGKTATEATPRDSISGRRPSKSPTEESKDRIPTDRRNTVVRALEELRDAAGVTTGADVHLLKRIPSQAGLGGASSDAATALRLANRAWDINWDTERLVEIAGKVGSDVPFFLSTGLARCWGRGEKMASIDASIGMHFVLVKPPVGLSTPDVFRHCSLPEKPVSSQSMIAALEAGSVRQVSHCLLNRLQPAASQLTEWIERLANDFQTLGCLGHMMSGSGSSYFGLFAHRRQALRAVRLLQARELGSVFAVHSTRGSLPLRP